MATQEIDAIRALLSHSPKPESLAEFRKSYDGFGTLFPLPSDIEFQTENISGLPAEWSTTPDTNQNRVIYYLHGGGYVIGSLTSHRPLVAELGRAARARTLALDYRLAPEHPFPSAVDDAIAGYTFLLDQGIDASSIAIAGDSAGGGLAIATMLAAKEKGLPQPACALCISPWVDLENAGASITTKKDVDPLLQGELLSQWAHSYLGDRAPRTPLASPLYADLSELAPLLIQVGSDEVLLDDAIRLAAHAKTENVPVQLETWPNMIHVWHHFYPMLEDARKALASAGHFIREHT